MAAVNGKAIVEDVVQRDSDLQAEDEDQKFHENFWLRFMTYIHWYPENQPTKEKELVLKLDLTILVFGCLSFFTKYLDQASITNAYVSGMKEDLNLTGNDINYINIVYWSSYCVSMIPACYLLTRYQANYILPAFEILWGLATFGCAWAQGVNTIYAMRFLIGLFESTSFTGIIYIIGSWYKPGELGRRVALFFMSSPLGTMFSGYLQAAAYSHLNGVGGHAGWRWLFIIDFIITVPIAFLGFLLFPDVPGRAKPRLLNERQYALAKFRLVGLTEPAQFKLSKSIFRRVFARWHWYVFVLQWCLMDQNAQATSTPFSLYLKAKSKLYSVVKINELPTVATAISIVAAFTLCTIADGTRNFWAPSLFVTMMVTIGASLLVAWNVGEGGRLTGFYLTGFEGAISPLTMSWASLTLAGDAEERAVVTASMNSIGQAITAWSNLLQYPAVEAPNFHKGFISLLSTTIVQGLNVGLLAYLTTKERKQQLARKELEVNNGIISTGPEAEKIAGLG